MEDKGNPGLLFASRSAQGEVLTPETWGPAHQGAAAHSARSCAHSPSTMPPSPLLRLPWAHLSAVTA